MSPNENIVMNPDCTYQWLDKREDVKKKKSIAQAGFESMIVS